MGVTQVLCVCPSVSLPDCQTKTTWVLSLSPNYHCSPPSDWCLKDVIIIYIEEAFVNVKNNPFLTLPLSITNTSFYLTDHGINSGIVRLSRG